jgi:hypothetical protein
MRIYSAASALRAFVRKDAEAAGGAARSIASGFIDHAATGVSQSR